jgi:hypothetical protein
VTNSRHTLPNTGIPFDRKGTEKRKTEYVEFGPEDMEIT